MKQAEYSPVPVPAQIAVLLALTAELFDEVPLDASWAQRLIDIPWPAKNLPEVVGSGETSLRSLLREHLFINIFQACAESLTSENATRLAAMQRAEKNIDELLATLQDGFHRLRQSRIDEELFDVVSGFEALREK